MRDTKMVDLEVNGLIYSLHAAISVVVAMITFWLLDNFGLLKTPVGYISIVILAIVFFIISLNLFFTREDFVKRLQDDLKRTMSAGLGRKNLSMYHDFLDNFTLCWDYSVRLIKGSIYFLEFISFLNFLSCFIVIKVFGLYWGSLSLIFCLSHVIIISCLYSYKNGEKAICDIHFKNGSILDDTKVVCINDSDVYVLDDNALRIISKSEISEIKIKKMEKNIKNLKPTALIFHGTEGYPEENWFPWLKAKLEAKGVQVFVPQFPTPPIVPAVIAEWFAVLQAYEPQISADTILIGHSLGSVFTLRLLERLRHKVKAVFLIGAPIGIKPLSNYDRDAAFSGFDFNWAEIKKKSDKFFVFHSDNDPYVSLANGQELAKHLGVGLTFIPNAGHFNAAAGYLKFEELWQKLEPIL